MDLKTQINTYEQVNKITSEGSNAIAKEKDWPFGNFFHFDYPQIQKEHLNMEKTYPIGYTYRNAAFDWTTDQVIDSCAQWFVYDGILFPKEQ